MNISAERSNDFLLELYNHTEGDTEKQVSMHDIGVAIGMDKAESSMVAEDLIMDQLVELKTLSGGIGITAKGLEVLQKSGVVQPSKVDSYRLSRERVVTADDKVAINNIVQEIQLNIPQPTSSYDELEELVIDLKTLEVQMLSPQPKTAIIRELLRSAQDCLNRQKLTSVAEQIAILIEK